MILVLPASEQETQRHVNNIYKFCDWKQVRKQEESNTEIKGDIEVCVYAMK